MNRAETRASIKTRREAAKSLYLSDHSADQVAVALGVSVHTAHEYKPYAMQHGRAGFYTVGKEGRIKRAYPARPIREAIEALFWTGLTVREIAAIHNLSIRTIKRLTPKELRRRNSAGGGNCKDTQTISEESACANEGSLCQNQRQPSHFPIMSCQTATTFFSSNCPSIAANPYPFTE